MGSANRDHLWNGIERNATERNGKCARYVCLQSGNGDGAAGRAEPDTRVDVYANGYSELRNGASSGVDQRGEGLVDDHSGCKVQGLRCRAADVDSELQWFCQRRERDDSCGSGEPWYDGIGRQQRGFLQHHSKRSERGQLRDQFR